MSMKLFHPKKGILISAGKRYKPVGNKQVDIFKDENGKVHELDGTETPYEEIESLMKEVDDLDMEDQMQTKKEIKEMEDEIDESADEEDEKMVHKEEKMKMHMEMQESIKNSSESITEAIKDIPEPTDHINDFKDFKDEIILAIQTETDKLDKEIDLSPVINAIKGIKFPEYPTPQDYTSLLKEIKNSLPREVDFTEVVSAIVAIPRYEFPELKFDKEGRLQVQVDRISLGGSGGFSSVQIENASHEKINPATSENQTNGDQLTGIISQPNPFTTDVQVIDTVHDHIHKGIAYTSFDVVQLTAGATHTVIVNTNDTNFKHSFLQAYLSEELEVFSYETVTTVSDGTAVQIINRNRNSTNTAVMTVFHTPTTLSTAGSTMVRHVRVGSKNAFSESQDNNELNLKSNTKYAITFTNQGSQTAYLNFQLFWYEASIT